MREETVQVRIYFSDYERFKKAADERVTTLAQIIREASKKKS